MTVWEMITGVRSVTAGAGAVALLRERHARALTDHDERVHLADSIASLREHFDGKGAGDARDLMASLSVEFDRAYQEHDRRDGRAN